MNEFIKKLIERLEEESYEIQLDGAVVASTKTVIELQDAKNIVNQLAEEYNKDVCEWKWVENGKFIQNPHTNRKFSHEPSMRNVYCNTCGKKISIVNWLKEEREE